MNSYELILILREEDETLKRIQKVTTDLGGKLTNTEKWEKRKLAYPIKKETSGYFCFLNLNFPPEKISDFKKKLLLDEGVLRFLLLVKE